MKFCPQCGNQIKEGQSFCNKCGSDLKVFKQYRENQLYESAASQKNKRWPYILFVILIVAILISGGLIYYFFFVKPEMVKSEEVTSTHHKTKEDIKKTVRQGEKKSKQKNDKEIRMKSPNIDVMSEDFENTYLKSDCRDGYYGIKVGMTKNEVEKLIGKPTGILEVPGFKWKSTKYGNITVDYSPNNEEGKVIAVGVSPDNVKVDDFLSRYYSYDSYTPTEIIYNNDKSNGYLVAVDIDGNHIAKIQCLAER